MSDPGPNVNHKNIRNFTFSESLRPKSLLSTLVHYVCCYFYLQILGLYQNRITKQMNVHRALVLKMNHSMMPAKVTTGIFILTFADSFDS